MRVSFVSLMSMCALMAPAIGTCLFCQPVQAQPFEGGGRSFDFKPEGGEVPPDLDRIDKLLDD